MMKDRYGNYVIQKCIEFSKGKQREKIIKKITACANILRKQANYSRHVYNFIEKLLSAENIQPSGTNSGNTAYSGSNVNNNYSENSNAYTYGNNQMSSGDVDNNQ